MPPLTFNIIRQSTQLSAARRGTVVMAQSGSGKSVPVSTDSDIADTVPKREIETPGCFMYTVKGSVPHLTPDTLRLQGFGGVNVSIEHILQDHQPAGFEKWPSSQSLSKFLHLQDFILFCNIRDSSRYAKVPNNSDRYLSMATHKGVRQLTLEDYLKVVRTYHPDIVASFSDSIPDFDPTEPAGGGGGGVLLETETETEPGPKRVKKSVDRSLKWLDLVLRDRHGIDALAEQRSLDEAIKREQKMKKKNGDEAQAAEGHHDRQAMEKTIEDLKVLSVSQGLNAEPTKRPWTNVSVFAHVVGAQIEEERIRSAKETAKRQEVDGFIVDTLALPGTREEVLKLLKVSLDHLPPEKPRLVYGMQTPEDVLKSIAMGADLFDTSYPSHLTEDGKASLYNFGTPLTSHRAGGESSSQRWINLWDDEHVRSFVPLLDGCECYACKGGRHTRAYINHLLKAHEMLATVLLMSHNMHQYAKFFASVRQTIQDGTFDQHAASFVETFGTEPKSTGEIHAAQVILEAALSKRNWQGGEEENRSSAADAAEERRKLKAAVREEKRAKKIEQGMRDMVNKKQQRLEKRLQQEAQLHQQKQ
ncbi:Queuine tRNA-ribosyltransferase subunit qtrtd1 [Dissophora globulifera]|uniref:Queuine tRNA-ribosyltransferase accessory subunit 2 n=1 Tax=Dissophora globulifera TaxID=979702 RepID=A0A9P6UUH7_9FUNG|nr:Queuine tRNA-ribosyltransferase subunit qtrtd1 [Dissophora globulifera]